MNDNPRNCLVAEKTQALQADFSAVVAEAAARRMRMEIPKTVHLPSSEECGSWTAERDRQRMEQLIEKLYAAAADEARMMRLEEKVDEVLAILKR